MGKISCTKFHVLVAVILAAISVCSADTCSSSTVEALLAFRSAFNDPSGTVFTNWGNGGDCCTWKGITCQDGNLVTLDVEGPSSNQLTKNESYSGKPGNTLSKLKVLQTLTLKNLQFSSKIPSQWSSLSDDLTILTVNNCDLQDDLPNGIASNSNLQTLDLKDNSLTGDIPDKLCNLKDLKYLDLSYNHLDTGNIPDCIANGGSVTNVNYGHQSNDSGDSSGGSGGNGSSSSGNGGNGGNGGSAGEGSNEAGLLVQSKVVTLFLSILCVAVF
uniref:Leucine-rich repeat-containing N-terminal plant-type domain-containing protein n=1 Tax=Physcomitrium patens TaxID=3218 RepID=A0A2K1L9L9_PHYPA|nr:protein NSP-INTERACTING KINASE 2-like [Physcomitrium patens]XP_024388093.1 protein NSP-INTERACTING KINASE 2-like [Physcomitrium patens]XP_024388102.1 protein NSP-INTERACTING KINASE 2-like [Physcomitrium patens]XP_024388113.1 protein NSP-INTERACTING KINASE 2-like [Physcomitrium patens]PNR62728.1 hypothetical protein PHYPA_001152 [Physcomitrium patens]|eukprot:XP_024388082.1 protein NSP-INTERACTING KINASE 2-like [Physcomitrella patens]